MAAQAVPLLPHSGCGTPFLSLSLYSCKIRRQKAMVFNIPFIFDCLQSLRAGKIYTELHAGFITTVHLLAVEPVAACASRSRWLALPGMI
jgi:hypothetical protein